MSQEKDTDSRIALLIVFALIASVVIGVLWFGAATVLGRGKADKPAQAVAVEPIQFSGAVVSFHFDKNSANAPDAAYATAKLGGLLELLRGGGLNAIILPFNGAQPQTMAAQDLVERRAQGINGLLIELGVPAQNMVIAPVQSDPLSTEWQKAQRVELLLQTPAASVPAAPVPMPVEGVNQPPAVPAAPAAPATPVAPAAPVAPASPQAQPVPGVPGVAVGTPQADGPSVVVEGGVVKFYFASGSAVVADGADAAVASVVGALKSGQRAIISGFTDPTGNAELNERLSKERAFAVRDVLVRQGAPEALIELERPQSHTGTGSNAEARRVEVRLAP